MLFNSLKFAAFFPLAAAGYFALPRRAANFWLLACSYVFYLAWDPRYGLLMLVVTLISWAAALFLEKAGRGAARTAALVLGVGANLSLLVFFKYAGFLVENANGLLALFGRGPVLSGWSVVLPVGISFYVFQAVGYTVDVWRGTVRAERNLFTYALFVSFFPQLVAGPIERSGNILPQFKARHRPEAQRFVSGLAQMLWGYFEKLILADRLSLLVDAVYASPAGFGRGPVLLAVLLFPFQIYCDFASYSDIAVGAARILGFDLMQNFSSPYLARSVGEYWRRWHISLSTWLRDYLYIPLGGSRGSAAKACRNIFLVFLASGLWHGAAWTFIAWGALHGAWSVAARLTAALRRRLARALGLSRAPRLHSVLQWAATFSFLALAFVLFRADSLGAAAEVYAGLFRPDARPFAGGFSALGLDAQDFAVALAGLAILFVADWLRYRHGPLLTKLLQKPLALQWVVWLAGIWLILVFGMYGEGYAEKPFIYFQF